MMLERPLVFDSRLKVLNTLADQFLQHGLTVTVDEETICVGRDNWDEYSKSIMWMLSAAPKIVAGEKIFFLFVVEEYDPSGVLQKYTIKLCNGEKTELYSWDLDTKSGQHVHDYLDGKKVEAHLFFEGTIEDIAARIMDAMRMYPRRSMASDLDGLR